MKRQWKKTAALMMAMMMSVFLLGACGGSDNGGDETDKSVEDNAGVREVVITVPDGWTVDGGTDDGFLSFSGEDSDCVLSLSATNSADLEKSKAADDSIATTDINEFYKQSCEEYEKAVKEGEMDCSDIEICDTDGKYGKMKHENGYVSLDATWLLNDNVYQLLLFDPDNVDFNSGSGIKDDPDTLSEEDIAMFEAVMESANIGDGDFLLKLLMSTASIGEYNFATPEGFSVQSFGKGYATLKEDGGETEITMSVTTEDDLKTIEDENGSHPESLEAEWTNRTQGLAEEDMTEIAGREGFIADYPDENGKKYSVVAEFPGDDGIYNIVMQTDAQGIDGSIKENAAELTDEEIRVFREFINSFSEK